MDNGTWAGVVGKRRWVADIYLIIFGRWCGSPSSALIVAARTVGEVGERKKDGCCSEEDADVRPHSARHADRQRVKGRSTLVCRNMSIQHHSINRY